MKRLLLLTLTILLLTACNINNSDNTNNNDEGEELTAHIDIDNDIIGDSYQVMRIIEKAVEADEKPSSRSILNDYHEKYIINEEVFELNDEEYELVMMTELLIIRLDDYITVASERRDFYEDKDKWYRTLETGEYQSTD